MVQNILPGCGKKILIDSTVDGNKNTRVKKKKKMELKLLCVVSPTQINAKLDDNI